MNSDTKMGAAKVHFDHDPQTLYARPESRHRAGTVQGRRNTATDRVPTRVHPNLMRVLDALVAIGRCVLLLDELIKETDTPENAKRGGGTSEHLRTLANFMTWMEGRERGVFVLATGNTGDLQSGLPEGLMERFPYIFFVDRPDAGQRAEIWKIHLEQQGCDPAGYNLEELATETDELVGRDIRFRCSP